MSHLEMSARLKIRPGQLDGFKAQAAEIMRLTREKDTQTRRYDWFINEDGTECEVHDIRKRTRPHRAQRARAGSQERLSNDFAYDHRMTVYGDVSQQLVDLFKLHAGGVGRFSFLQGLEPVPTV